MEKRKKDLLRPWWNENLDYLPLGAKWRGKWQKGQVKRMIREIDDRALDIQVAEKIFGHKVQIIEVTEYHDYGGQTEYPELGYKVKMDENPECVKEGADPYWYDEILLPHYSTDIKDAWTLLGADKIPLDIFRLYFPDKETPFFVVSLQNGFSEYFGETDTVEKAICLAALEAVK
jgi:hypothetical protein